MFTVFYRKSSVYLLFYIFQSSLKVSYTLFEDSTFSGIGIGIFSFSFKGNVTANEIKKVNLNLKKTDLFQRFGLSQFYKTKQFEYEKNYFSDFLLICFKNLIFI